MTFIVSITDDQIFTALKSWIIAAVAGEAVQGYTNRVSSPKGSFVEMYGLVKTNLSMNMRKFTSPINPVTVGTETERKSIDYTIQLDVYGATASDVATILNVAFTAQTTWAFFNNLVPGLAPLYMEDPRQSPITTGEQQYDQRWTLTAHMQFLPSITDAQESAIEVVPGVINVEATYPG